MNCICAVIRALLGQPLCDRPQFGGRGLRRLPWREHGRRVELVIGAIEIARAHPQRAPQLGRLGRIRGEVGWQAEALRHDADHFHRHVVEHDAAADEGAIAPELRLPQSVAEHRDRRAVGSVVVGGQRAAEQRTRAEHVERVRADQADGEPDRLAGVGEVLGGVGPEGHIGHRPGELAVVEHLLARHPGLLEAHPLAPHHHPLLGSVIRERGQQNRLDDAEDRGRRTDPQ